MTTLTPIHSRTIRHIRDTLGRQRRDYGDNHHVSMCLGVIDGAAASLADVAGPARAAEILYRAADEMVLRNIPAPTVRLRRKGILRRACCALGLVDWAAWCFVAIGVAGVYGVWRWM